MNADKIYAESLVNEYTPKNTSKTSALKKLDAKAKRPAIVAAFTLGIVGSLVLGTGMCLSMGCSARAPRPWRAVSSSGCWESRWSPSTIRCTSAT